MLGVQFKHHPDGHIIVGDLLMQLDEFMQIWPTYSGLPSQADGLANGDTIIGREYIPGSRHSLFTSSDTQLGGEYPWPEGDAITDAIDTIRTELNNLRNPPPTIEETRNEKLTNLRIDYEAAINAGIEYNGITFQCDVNSASNLNSVLTAIQNGWSLPDNFTWRDAANVDHQADMQFLQGLAKAMADNNAALFRRLQKAKDAVRQATTTQEIESVVF